MSAWGGTKIDNSGGGTCSSGFTVTQGSDAFLVTAGHCDKSVDKKVTVAGHARIARHQYFTNTNVYRDGSNADAVLVGISQEEASNVIFKYPSQPSHPITRVKPTTWYPTNSRICISARFSFFRCGKVKASSKPNNNVASGIGLIDQVYWVYEEPGRVNTVNGASGGPLFSYNTALGIHSRSDLVYRPADASRPSVTTMNMYGTKIVTIEERMNVSVKISINSSPGIE